MANLGEFLGKLIYGVGVDASGVDRGLADVDAKVEAALKELDAKDATVQLRAERDELTAELKTAQAELDAWKKKAATDVPIGADTSEFDRKVKEASLKVDKLKLKRANITVRLDEKGQLTADARRVAADLGKVEGLFGSLARKIGATRASLGPFTLTLKALVPVLGVLAPLLINLAGGAVALGGSLAQAAAGGIALASAGFAGLALSAGGAVLAIKPVITDFKTAATAASALKTAQLKYGKASDQAATAQKAFNHVIGGMPPQAAAAAKAWANLKQEFATRTGGIRADFFSVISDGLRTAHTLLPTFAKDATNAFHAASQGVHEWMQGLRTTEAQHLLDKIMGNFTKALPDVLHGLGQFITAFARISASASTFLPQFTHGFDQVATEFAHSTANANSLHQVMAGLMSQTHSWFGLLGATGHLLTTVFTGGAQAGQGLVDDLTASLHRWNAELQTAQGQSKLSDFFQGAAQNTSEFAQILGRALTLLFAISRITAPLASGMLDVVNAVGDLVQGFQKLSGARAMLAGIGAAIATYFIASKIAAFVSFLIGIPAAIRAIGAASTVTEAEINPFLGALSAIAGAFAGIVVFANNTKGPMSSFDAAMKTQKRDSDALTTSLHDQKLALHDLAGANLDVKQAHLDVAQARASLTAATHAANQAEDKYGKGSRQAKDADLAQRQAALSLKEARHQVTTTTDAQRGAENKLQTAAVKGVHAAVMRVDLLLSERTALLKDIHTIQGYTGEQAAAARGSGILNDKQVQLATVTSKLQGAQHDLSNAFDANAKAANKLSGQTHDVSTKQEQADRSSGNMQTGIKALSKTLIGAAGTSHGLGAIVGAVTNNVLGAFGAKKLNFTLPSISGMINPFQRGGAVEERKAKGGFTVPGSGDGDRYRTALPHGSFVMNRRATEAYGLQRGGISPVALESGERVFYPSAVNAIGAGRLEAMNSSAPRFAKGGGFGGGFAFPFDKGQYSWGRTDMGVDFTGTGAIRAMGAGRVISTGAPGWPEGGGVQYTLDSAIPGLSSRSIYVNEGVAATVSPGQRVMAGQQIASFRGSSIELGQATSSGAALAAPHYSEGDVTAEGLAMHAVLKKLESGSLVAPHIPRIHVKGPPGPLRDVLQAQADHLVRQANIYVKKIMPKTSAGAASLLGSFKGGRVVAASWFDSGDGSVRGGSGMPYGNTGFAELGWSSGPETAATGLGGLPYGARVKVGYRDQAAIGTKVDVGAGGPGLGGHPRAIDIGSGLARSVGLPVPFGLELVQVDPMATGGMVGAQKPGHQGGGLPGHQVLRLPPKPKHKKAGDFGTGPGSWYDWYHRAIDFYNNRGDTRQSTGKPKAAKKDWWKALREVTDEEEQVRKIIKHEHKRIRQIDHTKPPKGLMNSKPPKSFHFRDKKKGEKQKDYVKAKKDQEKTWRQNTRAWKAQFRQWQKSVRGRKRNARGLLPDLYQEERVDLPTEYNDIMAKITGQAADKALDQTAFGQERYQTLIEFGGNFVGLGFDVAGLTSRFGGVGGDLTAGPVMEGEPLPSDDDGATTAIGPPGTKPPPKGHPKPPPGGVAHTIPGAFGKPRPGHKPPPPTTKPGGGPPVVRPPAIHPPPRGGPPPISKPPIAPAPPTVRPPLVSPQPIQPAPHPANAPPKVIQVTNNYKTQPKDPHTWSANVKHELRAMT